MCSIQFVFLPQTQALSIITFSQGPPPTPSSARINTPRTTQLTGDFNPRLEKGRLWSEAVRKRTSSQPPSYFREARGAPYIHKLRTNATLRIALRGTRFEGPLGR